MITATPYPLTGAECITKFIEKYCFPEPFLVTGGACAFIVDSVFKNPNLKYRVMQHEQAAAMAADAIFRTNKKIGVTISTSGPGATNLVTGIACSWFDSIPSIHITGQVNQAESNQRFGTMTRQIGFQETDIVSIVKTITKFAKRVESISDLLNTLRDAFILANSGRKGPVLIDVPMDVQKEIVEESLWFEFVQKLDLQIKKQNDFKILDSDKNNDIVNFLHNSDRLVVLLGAGVGLANKMEDALKWVSEYNIPFTTTWNALSYISEYKHKNYLGSIGVYGSRTANCIVDRSTHLLVLGSRLDNRQRSSSPEVFAPSAEIFVIDIDDEELRKYENSKKYTWKSCDLQNINFNLLGGPQKEKLINWNNEIRALKNQITDGREVSVNKGELSPYSVMDFIFINSSLREIIVADCGANLCWTYQSFRPFGGLIFTAGGNSPMGYSLPASIGAYYSRPDKNIICIIGDGGMQINIQELQTISNNKIPIKIVILNNNGFGIIKQFQDTYFDSRYAASGDGYSAPNFSKIADAYQIDYIEINSIFDLESKFKIESKSPTIYDVKIPENALITPKLEMGHKFSDQFPYKK